ncbi:Ada metal-binding domain-containing protein [Sporomusa malonica]|uniref:Metal binding domain of Ada n=1 Tax=Sporomusa malonica TaxID=112901 RepID=A0A1W2B3H2_9FIRM|nr:Ada metal-binding domain-containing protein [Sporomusa malonica]SMC67537.1 Metal binding domain of Ada [Sporomusa malonica]
MTKRLTALLLTLTLLLGMTAAVGAVALDDCNHNHFSPSSTAYIGASTTGKFHYTDCNRAQRIQDDHRIYFSSRDEAVNAGYMPCKVCKP